MVTAIPPIPAYLNYPLIYFDMETASHLMFFILIAAVLCAFALISSSFDSIPGKDQKNNFSVRSYYYCAQPSLLFFNCQRPSGRHSFSAPCHGDISVQKE